MYELTRVDFDANRPINAMSVFGGFLYGRIAQAPQPRPADGVGAADRLRDLAQDAAHTPPMPTRNALAVSSMRGIGPVEYLAGAQNAPGSFKRSAYLRLQSTAAGVGRVRPGTQVR